MKSIGNTLLDYFRESTEFEDGSQEWTTMNWLSEMDDDTLSSLKDIADIFFQDHGDDVPIESVDYLMLCYLIAEVETGRSSVELTNTEKEDSVMGINLFVNFESLRRKGLVEVIGSGKVTELSLDTTSIRNTEAGKVVGGAIQTMRDLSNAVDK